MNFDDYQQAALRTLNPSHYVDYQDCKYVSGRRMLCSGVTELRQRPEAAPFRLGVRRASPPSGTGAALDRRRR